MKKLILPLFLVLILIVGCTQTGIEMPAHKEISAQELKKLIDGKDNQDFFLVDVHIPEQKHIPKTDAVIAYNEIEKNKDKFPKDKDAKIALYCLGGGMGVEAAKSLQELGYTDVSNLTQGIMAWTDAGYSLEE
ncbi:hypothetical protein LCGC14_2265460 [marine sediment metagenome]|uniref:Rhodanese domain-containing protein n=1 Tax=marine sediment metagenome TaxID=412755 RepID=A0A0F9CYI9_9ZZZZ